VYSKEGNTKKTQQKNGERSQPCDKVSISDFEKGVTQAADRSTAEWSRTILSPESLITLNGNAGNNFATNNGQFENGLLNSDSPSFSP